MPVLSSGVTPAVVLAATSLGWVTGLVGQTLASAVLVLRIAGTGLVYRRLREDVPPVACCGWAASPQGWPPSPSSSS